MGGVPGDQVWMRTAAEELLARPRELMASGRSYAEARRFAAAEHPDLVRLAAGGSVVHGSVGWLVMGRWVS